MLLLIILLLLVSCSLAANPGYSTQDTANLSKVTQISKPVIHRLKRTQFGLWIWHQQQG